MSARRPTAPRRRGSGDTGAAAKPPAARGAMGAADGHGAKDVPNGTVNDAAKAAAKDAEGARGAGSAGRPPNARRTRPGRASRTGTGHREGAASAARSASATEASAPAASQAGKASRSGPRPIESRTRLSLRGLGLILVVVVAFAILTPTLRHMVEQQEQLRSVTARLEEARTATADLERRQRLWADPDYVRAQARDRLGYVVPGERTYVVVDPETVTGASADTAESRAAQAARERAATAPWYVNVWESTQIAGNAPVPGEPTPEGAPADEIPPPASPGQDATEENQ